MGDFDMTMRILQQLADGPQAAGDLIANVKEFQPDDTDELEDWFAVENALEELLEAMEEKGIVVEAFVQCGEQNYRLPGPEPVVCPVHHYMHFRDDDTAENCVVNQRPIHGQAGPEGETVCGAAGTCCISPGVVNCLECKVIMVGGGPDAAS